MISVETLAASFRKALSGFIGSPNTPELQGQIKQALAEVVGEFDPDHDGKFILTAEQAGAFGEVLPGGVSPTSTAWFHFGDAVPNPQQLDAVAVTVPVIRDSEWVDAAGRPSAELPALCCAQAKLKLLAADHGFLLQDVQLWQHGRQVRLRAARLTGHDKDVKLLLDYTIVLPPTPCATLEFTRDGQAESWSLSSLVIEPGQHQLITGGGMTLIEPMTPSDSLEFSAVQS